MRQPIVGTSFSLSPLLKWSLPAASTAGFFLPGPLFAKRLALQAASAEIVHSTSPRTSAVCHAVVIFQHMHT